MRNNNNNHKQGKSVTAKDVADPMLTELINKEYERRK